MPDQSSAATEHAILQEITAPLEALPDDPLAVVNAEFPTALRGYDRLAVDEYVRRTRQLVAELQATRSPESAVRRALERVGDEITGILQRAHETAEQITAQSRSEADDRLENARQEAAQIIAAAEERVRDLDADTDRIWLERQRIVGDAEDLAGRLQALAKAAMDRFPADAAAGAAAPAAAEAYDPESTVTSVYDTEETAEAYGDQDAQAPAPEEEQPEGEPAEMAADDELAPPASPAADQEPESAPGPPPDVEQREDEPFAAGPGPVGDEDVEETLPFRPLPHGGASASPPPGSGPPSSESQEPPPPPGSASDPSAGPDPEAREASTSDDTTAVIRPASQAANRRLSR